MLSLYLGFSKRYSELKSSNPEADPSRQGLSQYTSDFLKLLIGVNLASTLMTYGLYTMNLRTLEVHNTLNLIYTLPIVAFGLFRHVYLVMHKGFGDDTSRELLHDRQLIASVLLFVICTYVIIS